MPQGESFPNPLDSLSVDIDANHLVGGQLSKFVEVWRTMGAPEGVLKVIKGYAIPFSSRPPLLPLSIPLPPCCLTPSSPLMDIQVKKLVDQRVLVRNPFDSGYLSPLFLVSKADGSQRPIINLKRLNLFLSLKKFHLINHFRLPDFLQKGDFLAKIDLSQAYFHVPIRPSHQRFLSVAYRDSLYCMTCLPFGLASAPQIFSSLTNWVASLLRKLGIRVIVYLDDFLLANQNPDRLRSQALMTVRILQNLGWTVNLAKSVLTPALSCQYLGIVWNPTSDFKSLPPGKQSVIYRYLLVILQSRLWSWKISKVILGYLSFAAFVVPLGKLHYRQIQWASRHLPRHQPLKQSVIPNRALSQIQWWLGALHRTSPIFPPSPQAFLTTDASNSGWGAVVNNLTFRGAWGEHQKEWHINLKEMFAVRRALELNLSLLQNKAVLVQSDNRTVVSYIHREGGTKSLKLLQEVERLFSVAACYNIGLIGRFIPGRYNAWADNLSRQKRLPDWNLSQNVTHLIFAQWGVPEIDLFATAISAVVPRYAALSIQDHQAHFVDAFSRPWKFSLAWIFPPPPLLPRVLHHLNSAEGLFILVVPCWEKVFWWPDLVARAVAPPMRVEDLEENLIDQATGRPPPDVKSLNLLAWLVRGGSLKCPDGTNPISSSYAQPGAIQR
uniref:Enzymatic polyprotein n=1 Tax=Cacopsylla melanoneura TaxID=428564 RepID=A0A8D8Z130_9HEMI